MIRLFALSWWCFALVVPLASQTGVVTSEDGKTPLEGAAIYAVGNDRGVYSGSDGSFALPLEIVPDTLIVSYLGYRQATIPVDSREALLRVRLQPAANALPDVTVKAYRDPERVTPEHRTIVDFLVVDDGIITLIHSTRRPNYRLRLTTFAGEPLDERPVDKPRPESLFAGCLGGLYLKYETAAVEIISAGGQLDLRERIAGGDFDRYLRPCLLADQDYVYTGYHRHQAQVFQLFSSPRGGGRSEQIAEIYDPVLLRRLGEEDLFKANKARTLEGLPGAEQMIANMYEDEPLFAGRVIYQPVNVQLFSVGEEVLLFDFSNHLIRTLPAGGDTSGRAVPFVFHQKSPFAARVIQDAVTERLYTYRNDRKYTYLYAVAPRTGLVREVAVIPAIYLKRLQIHAGTLYYLHRGVTFEDRWQYLYRVNVD